METQEYKKMYDLEESHWWFLNKRKLIFSFLKKYYPKKDIGRRILDVGCGTGIILNEFDKYGKAYGIDLSQHALKFCKLRGLKNVTKGSVLDIPFRSDYFDIVGCFDVLYHKDVSDDEKALKELARVCKKGGRIFITDSACKFLLGRHDIASHARTRYSAKEIRQKLKSAGFKIERLTYYNFFLFPFVFLKRKLSILFNAKESTDLKKENPVVDVLLELIMSVERTLLKLTNFPFGVSLFCVARKI
tara:strand:- start:609 stop:1346 length:738 start_codon:yes stop_codon:yes gene_type:complete